jgi:Mg2+-importing ATPase
MKANNLNQKNKKYSSDIEVIASQNLDETISNFGFENVETLGRGREKWVGEFGKNKLVVEKFNYLKEFFSSFLEPFNILLLAIGITNLLLYIFYEKAIEELVGFGLVVFMVLLAVVSDFIQEVRAYKMNVALHVMVENNYTTVELKNSDIKNIDIRNILKTKSIIKEDEITIGDILYFNVGDVIPADCKIIWSTNLFVDQSQLTGESVAIEKNILKGNKKDFTDFANILFSQSVVKNGSCLAIVVKISDESYNGIISKISREEETKTDFEKGISKVTKIILFIIVSAFIIVLIASSLRTGSWVNGTILGLTIVVALTPEALPAILSGNLLLGSKVLSKHKVVVKKLSIIQNLGSVNVLTTDKTGTLTNENIVLNDFHDFENHRHEEVAKLFFINSKFQSSATNLIDLAVVEYGNKNSFSVDDFEFVSENEFDYTKRILSVVVKNKKTKEFLQITKGSPQEMMNIISKINLDGTIAKLDDKQRNEIFKDIDSHSEKGSRSIIIATRILNDESILESDLTFEGVAMFDEKIKDGTEKAIKDIYKNNIDLKILSGDTFEVAKNIAGRIGFKNTNGIVGSDLVEHDHQVIKERTIFSKLNPIQKGEVINCLHETGKVVAYLGDGVNDSVALKLSDVGISVNNGSTTAKQSADIIMLEKDLNVLNDAFILGRKIFSNALKFIKLTIATNMGLMLTMLITSIWFTFRSMIPIQLLIQNLLFDFSNLVFVFDKVDDCAIKKPMKWNIKSFVPFVLMIALVTTVISIANFLIMGYGFNMFDQMNSSQVQSEFQTMFFIESFVTHMMVIVICRTERISFIQSNASIILWCGIMFLFGILILLVYVPNLNSLFSLTAPRPIWWAIEGGLILSMWMVFESIKKVYTKIFKAWI